MAEDGGSRGGKSWAGMLGFGWLDYSCMSLSLDVTQTLVVQKVLKPKWRGSLSEYSRAGVRGALPPFAEIGRF